MPTDRLVLRRPDDWHVHLRDGAMLKAVLPFTAHQFGRAIIMPNLKPPVTRTADAVAYRERILAALPEGHAFTPLMTAYLTDGTDADDLAQGFEDGVFAAAKLYPANATTNSAHGVTDLGKIAPVLERMAEIGMPLLIHGEVTDAHVDIFDREAVFLERTLGPLLERYAALRVVLEHATTAEAVAFVREHAASGRVGATITAHHLLINRSHLFAGGIRPHLYCLPIAKRETHRVALVEAATSGEGPFFLGTDTAPHTVTAKESACGCAGCFTAANAMELYAEAFEEAGALDKLEAFASLNGPRFYGLPVNEDKVVLERTPSTAPDIVLTADGEAVLPFRSGETTRWTFAGAA
ncbi:dihydroorotase [Azospirillum brasilense]|uniref:dihydroorotase n=1 Tax=Azospirillum brasilense TaxID=192 RepID=UPI000E68B0CF|nr:dihydroorotase [Azospirillum brasilense]NUB26758.1 dihydroorotase [Azospirillum brasilense]NUB31781.1 dihydroorotase [Azospirillum brasilense]RIW04814.1 dihydroorotase [Azospirillum brasilense]